MRRFFGGGSRFRKNDVVKLNEDTPYSHLKPGTVGMITAVYGGDSPSYDVEFIDGRGGTLDRLVVKEANLSPVDI